MINSSNTTTLSQGDVLPANRNAARTWSHGGQAYDAISRQISDAIEHCVDRLDPQPGEQVLDIATGTGWAARSIADRGACVTGIDFGPEVIAAARQLDKTGSIAFDVGDAECLPYPDSTFDAVVSTFGVMFCAHPAKAAAELTRVCKPGGRLALTTWTADGIVPQMFRLLQSYQPQKPPADASCPFAWGDSNRIIELLGADFNLRFEQAISYYRARDGAAVWQAFAQGFGPVVTLMDSLDPPTLDNLRQDFESLHERYRTGAGVLVERSYMVTVGDKLKA